MGMDVLGNKPKNETGEYFRRNIWEWTALATLVCMVAPDETAPCRCWFCNEYDGLDSAEAELLAKRLEKALVDGSIDNRLVAMFPQGGNRGDLAQPYLLEHGITNATLKMAKQFRGEVSFKLPCPESVKRSVREFISFLQACGGFVIS
jgi:hypothetical protein